MPEKILPQITTEQQSPNGHSADPSPVIKHKIPEQLSGITNALAFALGQHVDRYGVWPSVFVVSPERLPQALSFVSLSQRVTVRADEGCSKNEIWTEGCDAS